MLSGALGMAPSPARAQSDWFGGGNSASQAQQQQAQTALRLQQLEGQIRAMNGQIEQLTFQNRQLQETLRKMQQDYELRFQDLEAAGAAKRPAAAPPQKKSEIAPPSVDPVVTAIDPAAPTIAAPPVTTASRPGPAPGPQQLGQIPATSDQIGAVIAGAPPLDLGAIAQGRTAGTPPGVRAPPAAPGVDARIAAVPAVPSARDEYDAAYTYVLNGEYELAEDSLRQFIANHPTDRRVGAATYWLGETYSARQMHREAADAFLKSYTAYPDDAKAPDALLKLGQSLNNMGERQAACSTYAELLVKYPRASKALRDRATQERAKAKCA
ncbi:MAG: tol-pal system protein YbgF [Hyphomicrobiaceae bacterium]|nr:tol-pal system protein YbgF [Hyphomicrobiaceae bacterium]